MPQENTHLPNEQLNYRLLRIANERYGVTPGQLNDQQRQDASHIAAREYFLEQMVLASAEARQVVVPSSQVKSAFEKISTRYEDEDAFLQALDANGLTPEDLHQALERELRVETVLDLISSAVPEVDDTEVGLFYYVHLDKFRQPETRSARHILITINDEYPENSRQNAYERLHKIAERVRRHPHRFNEQALKHSECPTALEGGLLGRVPAGKLYPELDAVLFNLTEGGISQLIESPIGWHLLLCETIHPEHTVPLEEVLPKLRAQLTQRQRSSTQKKWLQSLLAAAAQ